MDILKARDAPFDFPLIAFVANGDLRYFADMQLLVEFPARVYWDGILIGMELVDSNGERWFVRPVERTSPEPPQRRWWQIPPFWREQNVTLDLGLEKGARLRFEAVRKRVCQMHEADMGPEE